ARGVVVAGAAGEGEGEQQYADECLGHDRLLDSLSWGNGRKANNRAAALEIILLDSAYSFG
ncbi:hypothetical protein, partial [Pseudomonas aeruginosa]|uniref:hypothetical protein n=1 Tax=Pseudomonas aeruginosa TaxID=287 RepID=UPI001ABC4444